MSACAENGVSIGEVRSEFDAVIFGFGDVRPVEGADCAEHEKNDQCQCSFSASPHSGIVELCRKAAIVFSGSWRRRTLNSAKSRRGDWPMSEMKDTGRGKSRWEIGGFPEAFRRKAEVICGSS